MRKTALLISAVFLMFLASSMVAGSLNVKAETCSDLWFARNQIYANNGYCFKSRRAINTFGRNCFPPYGRLSRNQQARVNAIKARERRRGCGRGGSGPAPQSVYASMSCADLWYARNDIYARNGHCFKTARGRNTFGRGCFPPYGKLGRSDRRRVAEIKRWEGRNGCR